MDNEFSYHHNPATLPDSRPALKKLACLLFLAEFFLSSTFIKEDDVTHDSINDFVGEVEWAVEYLGTSIKKILKIIDLCEQDFRED